MAVVEYMHHVFTGDHRRHIPGFIHDRGHWYNPADETWVGWTKTNADYYIPDTLLTLTKEDFVQRCIRIHNANPIMVPDSNNPGPGSMVPLANEAAVRAHAEQWYDAFVARNLAEEAGS
jgi:hypothetical protein